MKTTDLLAFLDDAVPEIFAAWRKVFHGERDDFLDRLLRADLSAFQTEDWVIRDGVLTHSAAVEERGIACALRRDPWWWFE